MHNNNSPTALHMLSTFLIANVLAREKLWNNMQSETPKLS